MQQPVGKHNAKIIYLQKKKKHKATECSRANSFFFTFMATFQNLTLTLRFCWLFSKYRIFAFPLLVAHTQSVLTFYLVSIALNDFRKIWCDNR